mgnify:FL=1
MYGVDLYGSVRLAVLGQGISQQEAARRFGIDRGTVSKMVTQSVPSGYRRRVVPQRPKLDAHVGFIDQILHDGSVSPKKRAMRSSGFMIGCARSVALMVAIRRFAIMCIRAAKA